MGASVRPDAGLEYLTLGASALSEFGPTYVGLLADIVQHASFPQAEFDRVKGDMLRELSISRSQPQSLAQEKFLQTLYPDHPRGRLFPTDETFARYTLEHVREFYARHVVARRTHVYVVGRFQTAALERAIRESFSGWRSGPPPTLTIPRASPTRSTVIVDRPGARVLPLEPPRGRDSSEWWLRSAWGMSVPWRLARSRVLPETAVIGRNWSRSVGSSTQC